MRAYYKNACGSLELTVVAKVDGELYSKLGSPLTPTGETVGLKGWPDKSAGVYITATGDVFYVPK